MKIRLKIIIASIAVIIASPACAQYFTMMMTGNGNFVADWARVVACANKPYPAIDYSDSRSQQMSDHYFRTISACRWALATRHAVWIEAGRSAVDNLFPPAPVSHKEDFKRKLVCDYSDLDKNGAGTIHCNADKW